MRRKAAKRSLTNSEEKNKMVERPAIKKPFPKQPENKPMGISYVSLL